MLIRLGSSQATTCKEAACQAVEEAMRSATHARLAIVFATPQYAARELAGALRGQLGGLPWVGCLSKAVFKGPELIERGLVIGVFDGAELSVGVGTGSLISEGARAAGVSAMEQALDGFPLLPGLRKRLVIFLPDTRSGQISDVLSGAVEVAGSGVAWAGGGAGDNSNQSASAQFLNGEVYEDRAVAAVVDLEAEVGVGVCHGWRPVGPSAVVTDAKGPEVRELEYERAFDVYKATGDRFVDQEVDPAAFRTFAMHHPIGIPQLGGEQLIRDPLTVDSKGALQCLGRVPRGAMVRMMGASPEALLDAARGATEKARAQSQRPLAGALVFDCVARYLMYDGFVEKELESVQAAVGDQVPLFGCLTFGEIGAFGLQMPQFHNKTVVVAALPREG